MNQPVRVLNLFTIMNRGGAETMIMNYYRNIDRTKVQFDFIVHRSQKGEYDDEIRNLGGQIFIFPAVRPNNFCAYKKQIREFLDTHEYRIIHSHTQELSYYFYKIAHEKGVPYIITHSHNASMLWDFKAPLRLLWRKLMFKYINIYFTCGIEAAVHYYGKKRAQRAILMKNAIDVDRFKFNMESRIKIRKEFNICDGEFIIGHIGRFTPQKNHFFLLDVFKAFYERNKNTRLILVGEEDDKKVVREKARRLGIINRIIFTGIRKDIPDLLSAFDCVLMPSLFEGFSVAMLEEQSSGLPLITSSNVPSEIGLLPSTEFVSLKAGIETWVTTLEKYLKIPRDPNATNIISKAGYDIKANAVKLQNFYLSLK